MRSGLNLGSSRYIAETIKEEYKSLSPSLINRSFEWKDKQINILLESTMHELGELNAYCKLMPNIDRYIPLFIAREVVASNHMEGIASNLGHAFTIPSGSSQMQKLAWKELRNHVEAINWGVEELKRFPLSVRLVKQTHKILYSDLPDEETIGGKMRTDSPWETNTIEESSNYLPPNKNELKRLINDGKKFWRNDDLELPLLIKMAISLYQFENVLPFLNGNGRTARTLMILELLSLGFLEKPIFCLSRFFEQNRLEYYHRLNQVRTRNDIEQWIKFFLHGISQTSQESKNLLNQVRDLITGYQARIETQLGKKRHKSSHQLLQIMLTKPYLSVNEISEHLELSFQSANQLVRDLESIDMIREISGVKRNRVFHLWEYLKIFEE
ncbi:MAG: Fic family protein [Marinifilaceae bacterium]